MTILSPTRPTITYGPPPKLGVHPEAGGFTATCACQWVHWTPDQKAAATDYAAHVKKCKTAGAVAA